MTDKIYIEPFEVDQRIKAHSRYYAGRAGSIFYRTLKDESKILGAECKACKKIYYPPRTTCGKCFSELDENKMVEIGPNGTLETYTKVSYTEEIHPENATGIYGVIKLDGADTGMTHFIDMPNGMQPQIGMRLEPVFSEQKQGNILDIKHFRPIAED